jgi:predicted enzyme related to lactoylglutathione lyase
MANAVAQFQLISRSPDETARFYGDLFGWKVNAQDPLGYRRIDTGSSDGIQGGIWPAPPQAASFVQLIVSVEDVHVAVARAEQLGAKILIPPTMLPEGDEMAVLRDTQGIPFAVWRASQG